VNAWRVDGFFSLSFSLFLSLSVVPSLFLLFVVASPDAAARRSLF